MVVQVVVCSKTIEWVVEGEKQVVCCVPSCLKHGPQTNDILTDCQQQHGHRVIEHCWLCYQSEHCLPCLGHCALSVSVSPEIVDWNVKYSTLCQLVLSFRAHVLEISTPGVNMWSCQHQFPCQATSSEDMENGGDNDDDNNDMDDGGS